MSKNKPSTSKRAKEAHEEVEEENVVIEFEGNFNLDGIKEKELQIIGIDTNEPVLKIDSRYYKIDMKDSIGSRLVFKQDEAGKLSYYTKSDKWATARRVLVKPK